MEHDGFCGTEEQGLLCRVKRGTPQSWMKRTINGKNAWFCGTCKTANIRTRESRTCDTFRQLSRCHMQEVEAVVVQYRVAAECNRREKGLEANFANLEGQLAGGSVDTKSTSLWNRRRAWARRRRVWVQRFKVYQTHDVHVKDREALVQRPNLAANCHGRPENCARVPRRIARENTQSFEN